MRVYRDNPNSSIKDDFGTFEGWSDKYDEWLPIFSPKIYPWGTKIGLHKKEETQCNDEFDHLLDLEKE